MSLLSVPLDDLRQRTSLKWRTYSAETLAAALPQLDCQPTLGTYLVWLDCSPLKLADPAREFRDCGEVAFSPGSVFSGYHRQWVRITVECSPAVLDEAVARMVKTVESAIDRA